MKKRKDTLLKLFFHVPLPLAKRKRGNTESKFCDRYCRQIERIYILLVQSR